MALKASGSANTRPQDALKAATINGSHPCDQPRKLEARLIQTDLQLYEAIGIASAAKSQGVRINL